MPRRYDQRGTPFSENVRELWRAIKKQPRQDGRGWIGAVFHELTNVGNEAVRRYSKAFMFLLLFLLVALIDCRFSVF